MMKKKSLAKRRMKAEKRLGKKQSGYDGIYIPTLEAISDYLKSKGRNENEVHKITMEIENAAGKAYHEAMNFYD